MVILWFWIMGSYVELVFWFFFRENWTMWLILSWVVVGDDDDDDDDDDEGNNYDEDYDVCTVTTMNSQVHLCLVQPSHGICWHHWKNTRTILASETTSTPNVSLIHHPKPWYCWLHNIAHLSKHSISLHCCFEISDFAWNIKWCLIIILHVHWLILGYPLLYCLTILLASQCVLSMGPSARETASNHRLAQDIAQIDTDLQALQDMPQGHFELLSWI